MKDAYNHYNKFQKGQKMSQPFSCLKAAARIKTMWYAVALTLAYKTPLIVEFRKLYPWSKLDISLNRWQKLNKYFISKNALRQNACSQIDGIKVLI